MEKDKNYGIDVLKPFIVWAFTTGAKFEGLKDYKLVRKITIIVLGLLSGLKYLNKMQDLWDQFKDLDEAEAAEIHAEVCKKFKLENTEVELMIEEYFGYVLTAWLLIAGAGIIAMGKE